MVKKEKCRACRSAKQKCLPEGRTWDSNLQERCTNCIKGHRLCGPNETPPDPCPRRRVIRTHQFQGGGSVAQVEGSGPAEQFMENAPGSIGTPGRSISYNLKELRIKLNDLDAEVELLKQIQLQIEASEARGLQNEAPNLGSAFQAFVGTRGATSQSLFSMIKVVEILADGADAAGETDLAEIAYTRMLDIYRGQPFCVGHLIRPLLSKMASLYSRTDQPLRAEKCCLDILELRDSSGEIRGIVKEAWESLAMSFPKTSVIISDALASKPPALSSFLNLQTPFPPVHRMLRSEHAPSTQDGLYHSDSTAGVRYIVENIGKFPEIDLEARDIHSQSALFLAAFLKQEDVGYALMTRISTCPSVLRHQLMNVRDLSGQTVLGIAIISCCSLGFIRSLIDNGAEIDPETLLREPYTPLQAACMTGNPDAVELLLKYGADTNRVYPGHLTPLQLADIGGHGAITELITRTPRSGFQSGEALSPQPLDPVDNEVTPTVHGNFSSSSSTIISDNVQDTSCHVASGHLPHITAN